MFSMKRTNPVIDSWAKGGAAAEEVFGKWLALFVGGSMWMVSQIFTIRGFVYLLSGPSAVEEIGNFLQQPGSPVFWNVLSAITIGLSISALEIVGRARWDQEFWSFFTKVAVVAGSGLTLAGFISGFVPTTFPMVLLYWPMVIFLAIFMEVVPEPLLTIGLLHLAGITEDQFVQPKQTPVTSTSSGSPVCSKCGKHPSLKGYDKCRNCMENVPVNGS